MQPLKNYLTREGWKKDLEETLSRENTSKYKKVLDLDKFIHFGFPGIGISAIGAAICYTSYEQYACHPITAIGGHVFGSFFVIGGLGGVWLGYGCEPSEGERP